jgi:hypothetical protein
VVGARGVLGEQQRSEKLTQVVAFASNHPRFSMMLKDQKNLKQLYQDAGVKNPEQFIKNEDEMEDPAVQQLKQQAQQIIKELTAKLQESEKAANDKIAGLQQKMQQHQEKTQVLTQSAQLEHAEKMQQMALDYNAKMADIQAKLQVNAEKITADLVQQRNQMLHEIGSMLHTHATTMQAKAEERKPQDNNNEVFGKLTSVLDELKDVMEADTVPVHGPDGRISKVTKQRKRALQ